MSDYLGIYQGSVVDNNDPQGIGQVTCLIPAVLGAQVSPWCHPIYPTVYKPNVGDIVWVQFINGDPTKPIYFSSEAVTAEKIEAGTITADRLAFNLPSQADLDSVSGLSSNVDQLEQIVGTDPDSGLQGSVNNLQVVVTDPTTGLQTSVTDLQTLTKGWQTVGATTIDGSQITSNTITANKLNVVMGGGNLLNNSRFSASGGAGITAFALPTTTNATVAYDSTHPYFGTAGGVKVTLPTGTNQSGINVGDANYCPTLLSNTKYTFSAWTWNPSTGGSTTGLQISVQGTAVPGTVTSNPNTATDQWVRHTVSFTTTAAASPKPSLFVLAPAPTTLGQYFWVGAVQLEIGEIGTAYSPKSSEILPGTIATPMLQATAIDGMTITGATIQTTGVANKGVKIDTNGLRIYNSAGTGTNFSVDANGNITMTGTLTSSSTVSASSISGGTLSGQTISGGTITGATITGNTIRTSGSSGNGYIMLDNTYDWIRFFDSSGSQTGYISSASYGGQTYMTLKSGSRSIGINSSNGVGIQGPFYVQSNVYGTNTFYGDTTQTYMRDPVNSGTWVRTQSGVITLSGSVNAYNDLSASSLSASGNITSTGGNILASGSLGSGGTTFGNASFTANAGGAVVADSLHINHSAGTGDGNALYINAIASGSGTGLIISSGQVMKSSGSSRDLKYDIEPAEIDDHLDALNDLGVYAYHYYNAFPEGRLMLGVIVEEMIEKGLGNYVEFEDDVPVSPSWNQIIPLLLAANQRLSSRIDALTSRIEALEAKEASE